MGRSGAVISALLWFTAIARAAPAEIPMPQEWVTPGTRWQIKLTQHSRGSLKMAQLVTATEAANIEFEMTILVLPPIVIAGRPLARFEFTPSREAPVDVLGQKYLLEVDLGTGRAHALKLAEGRYPGTFAIEPAGEERVLLTEVFGFPVDWIVRTVDLSLVSGRSLDRSARIDNTQVLLMKSLSRANVDGGREAVKIELTLAESLGVGLSKRVVQIWVPGESWWRTFQRYSGGRLDLEATVVSIDRGC